MNKIIQNITDMAEKRIVVRIENLINKLVVVGNDIDYNKVADTVRYYARQALSDVIKEFSSPLDGAFNLDTSEVDSNGVPLPQSDPLKNSSEKS